MGCGFLLQVNPLVFVFVEPTLASAHTTRRTIGKSQRHRFSFSSATARGLLGTCDSTHKSSQPHAIMVVVFVSYIYFFLDQRVETAVSKISRVLAK